MFVHKNKNVKQETIQANKQFTLLRTEETTAMTRLVTSVGNIGRKGWFSRMVINNKAQRMQNF